MASAGRHFAQTAENSPGIGLSGARPGFAGAARRVGAAEVSRRAGSWCQPAPPARA
jgi:hypothetical protein